MEGTVLRQDEDGHWYRIPKEKVEKFRTMMEEAYRTDDFNEFIKEFSEYMTGGDPNN